MDTGTLSVNGTTLAYRSAGDGPLALFVHGYPLDSSMWTDQLSAVAGLRRCVALDLRGYGASGPVTGSPLTMEQIADDVAAAVPALGAEQADVVALSMGGYAALALWERHAGVVRSLVLADTRSLPDTEEGKRRREEGAVNAVAGGRGPLAEALTGALLSAGADLTARARLRTMVEATPYETIVASLRGMAARPDRTELLGTITVPTLVVVGEEDTLASPEEMHQLAGSIPGALFKVIEGAGHLPPIEKPDAFNAVLAEFFAGA
jgi:pimeloyl-ACP methyl ester carboxylesterase